jgi:hypothetical protein
LASRRETSLKVNRELDAADVEAVVIALYGRRLVTDDVLARELDEDVRVIARTIWA